jgi:predicted Zn-dependent protease
LHSRTAVLTLALVLASAVSGCEGAPQGEGPGHRVQILALSPRQELQLGREAYQEVLDSAPIVDSGPEVEQVRRVSSRIAEAVQIEPLQREINLQVADYPFEWEYSVIQDDRINAFCLPGGKICVFTGLLKVVQNDDQLAAVIGHEVAHALAHHVSERLAREQRVRSGLLRLSFDRQQELEADHIGIFLTAFAGYDPEQAVVFWEEMQDVQARRAHLPELLSDHPSDARRMRKLQEWVPLAEAAKRAYDEGRIAPAPVSARR